MDLLALTRMQLRMSAQSLQACVKMAANVPTCRLVSLAHVPLALQERHASQVRKV